MQSVWDFKGRLICDSDTWTWMVRIFATSTLPELCRTARLGLFPCSRELDWLGSSLLY